eukprot:TRINITY_DN92570_c0_g1_i1.p2 TRINITY_DN92570_c0_g1~~TRINITY_DN92570_c0_g1_i1.p2  ORF type:complete len:130 (+),score=30.60 TRINITY_DN92570_c0_g1_i1:83-472(+)
MGVASKAQIRHAKMVAKANANKTGKHRAILTKKKLKHQRNQERNQKKKETRQALEERGRNKGGEDASASAAMDVEGASRKRSPSKPIKPGTGSGTPGARAASAKVPKAVRVSKRGGRRRKATWRSHGMG